MWKRRGSVLFVCVLSVSLVMGCGDDDDEREPERVVNAMCQQAVDCGDWQDTDACVAYTKNDVDELRYEDGAGCEERLMDFYQCLSELSCFEWDEALGCYSEEQEVENHCDSW